MTSDQELALLKLKFTSFQSHYGVLDGKRGLIWNFLQVFWYRFLVDVKVFEFEIKHQYNSQIIIEKLNKQFEN